MYENGHPVVRNVPAKEDIINILHNHKTPSFPASRVSQNTMKTSPPTHNTGTQILRKESSIPPHMSKLPSTSPIKDEQEKKKKNREHSHHHHHHHHHHSKSPIDNHSEYHKHSHLIEKSEADYKLIPHQPYNANLPPTQQPPLPIHQSHPLIQPPNQPYANPYSYPVYPPRQSYSNPYYSGGNGNYIPPPAQPPQMPFHNPYLPYQYPPPPPAALPPPSYSSNNLDKELFSQLKDMLSQQQELQTTKLINQQLTREIENERQQNQLNLLLEQKRLVEQQRNEMNEKINDLKSFVKEQIQEKPLRVQGNTANQFGDDLILPYHPLPSLPSTPQPQPQPPYYPPQQQPPIQPIPQPYMPSSRQQPQQQPSQPFQSQPQFQPIIPPVVTNTPNVPGPNPINQFDDMKFLHKNPYSEINNNNNNNIQPQPTPSQPSLPQSAPIFKPVKDEAPKPIERMEYKANILISHMTCNAEIETPICEIRVVRHDNYDNPSDIFICEKTHYKDGKYTWNQGVEGILFISNEYNTMLIRILSGDYNLCYWAAFSVFAMDNNKINKLDATINLPLFDPPDILSSNKKEISKDNAIIEFTISKNQLMIQQPLINQMNEPFIPYHKVFNNDEKFQETDGADIYIDGLRSLPDCATITKVNALVALENYEVVMKSESKIVDLDELRYDPYFDMKMAFRPKEPDGTATLIIRVDTIEEYTKKIKTVGYSFFPLFCKSKDDDSQPTQEDKEFVLRTGNYQLRIHPIDFVFRKDSIREEEDPIASSGTYPCTTVTLRIKHGFKKKDNTRCYYIEEYEKHGFAVENRRDYCYSCYDTKLCDEFGMENAIYYVRKNRANLKLSECYEKMIDEEILTKLNYNKDGIKDHLTSLLNNKPKELINPSLLIGNLQNYTFQVCIESVFGYDKKYSLKVVHIVIPTHAEYFENKKYKNCLKYTKNSNWESRIGSISFDLENVDNHQITYSQNATIIFQLYTVSDYGKVVEIGWAALPIFENNNKSILYGKYLIAVFKESFENDFVTEFNDMPFDEVMKKHIKKCKGISILVRLNDVLLGDFLNPNFYPIENRYLPNDGSKDPYKKWINEIPQANNNRKSLYTTIMPRKYENDTKAYEKMTNEAIEKYLGINEVYQ